MNNRQIKRLRGVHPPFRVQFNDSFSFWRVYRASRFRGDGRGLLVRDVLAVRSPGVADDSGLDGGTIHVVIAMSVRNEGSRLCAGVGRHVAGD